MVNIQNHLESDEKKRKIIWDILQSIADQKKVTTKEIIKSFNIQNENEQEKVLNSYYNDVNKILNNDKKDFILNQGNYKEIILISTLIEKTENELSMVVNNFSHTVHDQDIYIKAIEQAIWRGVKISIIFLEEPKQESLLLSTLNKYKDRGGKIDFYKGGNNITQRILEKFPKYESAVQFIIFDDNNVQVEINPTDYNGFAVINDKEYAKDISNFYKEDLINSNIEIIL